MGSYLSYATMSEVDASNIIKRSMRYNRDRIFNLIATQGRANVSNDVLIAYMCIYQYNNDANRCAAIMGCDMEVFDYGIGQQHNEWEFSPEVQQIKRSMIWDILDEGREKHWTSKKIVKTINQSLTLEETLAMTGWGCDKEWNECTFGYPQKYLPRIKFICARKQRKCYKHALLA